MKLNAALCAMLLIMFGCSGGDEPEEPVKPEAEEPAEEKAEEAEAEPEEPAAEPEEPVVEEVPATPAEPEGFDGPKVWKYVSSFALNVRSAPDKESATVVRHVKWGDKVEVSVNGDWAKLGTGEYISTKFLSDTDPALKQNKSKKKAKKKGK